MPPFEVLKRLHRESADREREAKVSVRDLQKDADREIKRNEAEREKATVSSASGGTLFVSADSVPPGQPVGTRKGPFCRVTCLVHHADTYDVETDKEFCDKNQIPSDAEEVPGWIVMGNMEYRQPWPRPATPGFHSYKLYWQK